MMKDVEFCDFSVDVADRRALIALLAGVGLGVLFWSALIFFVTS